MLLHESITTTSAKAKAVKGLVDRLIVKAKENTKAAQGAIQSFITQKEIYKKLIEDIALRYPQRQSGFTQIVRLGERLGDSAMTVRISLVEGRSAEKEKPQDKKVKKEKEVAKKPGKTKVIAKKRVKKVGL